jgi:hypothetical protein
LRHDGEVAVRHQVDHGVASDVGSPPKAATVRAQVHVAEQEGVGDLHGEPVGLGHRSQ